MGHPQQPLPTEQQYIVYCDESRHDSCDANRFMGIGGLWLPYGEKDAFRRRFDAVAKDHGLGGELKWSKVSAKTLGGYKAIIDEFASSPALRFRTILVDHAAINYARFHRGDQEFGFYAFYYHMLTKWLVEDSSYIIVLDHKVNSEPGRYAQLEHRLRQALPESTHLRTVTVANSRESRLAQLADLLTGAVTAAWCETPGGTPKAELQSYIAECVGVPSLRTASLSPAFTKFNVFRINLIAGATR